MASNSLQLQGDFKIPVPWGHLAAKVWGPDDGVPVLALHGWQDNAGSFDTIAPLLPSHICLVCLDLCGHGFSSHYPPGMFLNIFDYIFHVKLVVDHYNWDTFSILSHSMGAQIALIFTSMFPEKVKQLISLDAIKLRSSFPEDLPTRMKRVLNDFQALTSKMERPQATRVNYAQAREKLIKNYKGSVDEKHADILLSRSLIKVGEDEYEYTRDLRTIIPPYVFHDFTTEELKSFACGIKCPFLLIKARNSITSTSSETKELHSEFLDIYRNASEDFRYIEVDGKHHVHLTLPHLVASHIHSFIESKN